MLTIISRCTKFFLENALNEDNGLFWPERGQLSNKSPSPNLKNSQFPLQRPSLPTVKQTNPNFAVPLLGIERHSYQHPYHPRLKKTYYIPKGNKAESVGVYPNVTFLSQNTYTLSVQDNNFKCFSVSFREMFSIYNDCHLILILTKELITSSTSLLHFHEWFFG